MTGRRKYRPMTSEESSRTFLSLVGAALDGDTLRLDDLTGTLTRGEMRVMLGGALLTLARVLRQNAPSVGPEQWQSVISEIVLGLALQETKPPDDPR